MLLVVLLYVIWRLFIIPRYANDIGRGQFYMVLKGSVNFGSRGSTALGFGGHAHRAFPISSAVVVLPHHFGPSIRTAPFAWSFFSSKASIILRLYPSIVFRSNTRKINQLFQFSVIWHKGIRCFGSMLYWEEVIFSCPKSAPKCGHS